jgi:hypothetical protein
MLQITFQDVFQTTTARGSIKLGTVARTPDGAMWKYAKASTGGLALGNVAVPAAQTAVDNVTSSTDAQGRKVYITKASAGWTVGQFEDGYGVIDDGTGVGQTFRIETNTSDTLTLYKQYALATALAVADSDLTINTPGTVVKSLVTDKAQQAQGIAQVAFAASDYGWLLVQGQGRVIAGEVLTIDLSFVTGDDTAGQVLKGTTAKGAFDEQYLGYCITANAAADQGVAVYVNIA